MSNGNGNGNRNSDTYTTAFILSAVAVGVVVFIVGLLVLDRCDAKRAAGKPRVGQIITPAPAPTTTSTLTALSPFSATPSYLPPPVTTPPISRQYTTSIGPAKPSVKHASAPLIAQAQRTRPSVPPTVTETPTYPTPAPLSNPSPPTLTDCSFTWTTPRDPNYQKWNTIAIKWRGVVHYVEVGETCSPCAISLQTPCGDPAQDSRDVAAAELRWAYRVSHVVK